MSTASSACYLLYYTQQRKFLRRIHTLSQCSFYMKRISQITHLLALSLSKLIFVFAVFVGAFWLEFYDAKIVSVVYYKSENMRNSSKTRLRARKSDRTSNQKSAYSWSYRYVITVIISIQFLDALHSMFDVCAWSYIIHSQAKCSNLS